MPETTTHEIEEESGVIPNIDARLMQDLSEIEKISAALPAVSGLGDLSDREFDDLAKKATDAFEELMDLGMNVEARYSTRVFEVASSMLKNAIDAKSAKIDKKLKVVDLQLKKAKLDKMSSNPSDSDQPPVESSAIVVTDRNSLLEKIRRMK